MILDVLKHRLKHSSLSWITLAAAIRQWRRLLAAWKLAVDILHTVKFTDLTETIVAVADDLNENML